MSRLPAYVNTGQRLGKRSCWVEESRSCPSSGQMWGPTHTWLAGQTTGERASRLTNSLVLSMEDECSTDLQASGQEISCCLKHMQAQVAESNAVHPQDYPGERKVRRESYSCAAQTPNHSKQFLPGTLVTRLV